MPKRSSVDNQTMQVLLVLCMTSALSVGMFLIRVLATGNIRFWFMLWNLFLAWLPGLFVLWLRGRLATTPWASWQNIVLTILWLSFLPNSFYLVSDLIHLQSTGEILKLYDAVLMMSFILNGLVLGYISVFIVHTQLLKRLKPMKAHFIIGIIFLACGFAIYLGRYLRWNTWDVLISPAGLLFDISDRFINPGLHSETFVITAAFFVLLGSFYVVGYKLARLLQNSR